MTKHQLLEIKGIAKTFGGSASGSSSTITKA